MFLKLLDDYEKERTGDNPSPNNHETRFMFAMYLQEKLLGCVALPDVLRIIDEVVEGPVEDGWEAVAEIRDRIYKYRSG